MPLHNLAQSFLLKDLNPEFSISNSNPEYLISFKDKILLSAYIPGYSTELALFDTADLSLSLVKDISTCCSSNPEDFIVFNDQVFFTAINIAAYLFGAMFVLQGILFLVTGVFQNRLSFKFRFDIFGITGITLIIFALVIYPIFGFFLGHVYPSSPTFGLPCPTTIFTFGILLLIDKKCPAVIMIIPFIWSVIGFTAAFSFGVIEDTGLLIAGLLTMTLLIVKRRKFQKE